MTTPEAAFDTLTPLTPLMDKCVHCGFCLSTCPSYLLLGREMDSPRGRIYLMKAGTEGRVGIGEAFVEHFDTCLGCMACETACPSGVRYAPLIEETRAVVEHHHRRPLGERLFRQLLFLVLPFPARLRLLAWPMGLADMHCAVGRACCRWLPAKLRNLIELAPVAAPGSDDPGGTRANGGRRRRPAARRPAHRMRAACVLQSGEPGHRPRPVGRGM